MNGFRYYGKGWSGRKYYMEMTPEEVRERESFRLFLGVIIGMTIMGAIMAMAAGVF